MIHWKHPQSACTGSGWLTTMDDPPLASPHRIRWTEYGNPAGEPVMLLHGGPGAGCTEEPAVSRLFDPQRYRIILFDQRGCGMSEPNAAARDPKPALLNNQTRYLIEDIAGLRKALRINGKMHLLGSSWGSTLALAFAIKYPQSVQTLILRSIFLCRKQDLDYFYQGNAAVLGRASEYRSSAAGAYLFYPEAWKRFVETISDPDDRTDMIKAYAAMLSADDRNLRIAAGGAWSVWEASASYLQYDPGGSAASANGRATASAIIESHYFLHGGFLGGDARDQNYLLNNVAKIKDIPVHIVQGRYDQVCPMYQAEELVAALRETGSIAVNYVITVAGHGGLECQNYRALMDVLDTLPLMVEFRT